MSRVRFLAPLVAVTLIGSACGAEPPPARESQDADEAGDPLAGLSWLSARAVEVDDVTTKVELALVRADGSVAWLETVALHPQVPGGLVLAPPRGGVMAVGTGRGNDTDICAIHAADGEVVELSTFPDQVVGAVIDSSGENVYVFLSGDDEVILRLPTDGSEPEEILRRPVRGRLILTWDRLAISPNGRWLTIDHCIADGCHWEVVDLETREIHLLTPEGAASRVDLSNDTLLAGATDCGAGACPFLLIDLVDGSAAPWDPDAHNARFGIAADGRTLLLHDDWSTEGFEGRITISDPETGASTEVTAEDQLGQPLVLSRPGQDTWVPAGWEPLAPPGMNLGEAGGPTLLQLDDGTVHHLTPAAGR